MKRRRLMLPSSPAPEEKQEVGSGSNYFSNTFSTCPISFWTLPETFLLGLHPSNQGYSLRGTCLEFDPLCPVSCFLLYGRVYQQKNFERPMP
jgi:hypothetical protein